MSYFVRFGKMLVYLPLVQKLCVEKVARFVQKLHNGLGLLSLFNRAGRDPVIADIWDRKFPCLPSAVEQMPTGHLLLIRIHAARAGHKDQRSFFLPISCDGFNKRCQGPYRSIGGLFNRVDKDAEQGTKK